MFDKELIGYPVSVGYIGYVNGKKMLFESEGAYEEYMEETEEDQEN